MAGVAALHRLVLLVAPVTVVTSCATAGTLASSGAKLAGAGPDRALGRADAAVRRGAEIGRAAHPAAFVAAVSGAGQPGNGLATFSSADGRLLRWLVRSKLEPLPVAVSPDGRWVYFYNRAALVVGCPRTGFAEPVLWQVRVHGGRPRRVGINTTSIAFSPDGRMVARTSSNNCGRTVWILVRDRRTGSTRHILLARNALTSNNPIFSAKLSWAPDDRHLAVAVSPAAAINALAVIDARRATGISAAPAIRPCAGRSDGCLDPGFDIRGRLTFLKWRNQLSSVPEWVLRWHHGRLIRLFRLSRNQSAGAPASIATDRTGTAVLLEGGLRRPQIWRWSRGHLELVLRSTPQRVVTSPLWLRHA
jgi:DNA-binding beta-propeller fold protein YncE